MLPKMFQGIDETSVKSLVWLNAFSSVTVLSVSHWPDSPVNSQHVDSQAPHCLASKVRSTRAHMPSEETLCFLLLASTYTAGCLSWASQCLFGLPGLGAHAHCGGLNKKCPLQCQIFEHLIPSWWCDVAWGSTSLGGELWDYISLYFQFSTSFL